MAVIVAPALAIKGPDRAPSVVGKGAAPTPPKTTGQIWPRGKR